MSRDDQILEAIRYDRDLADALWRLCEFDVTRDEPGEPVYLPCDIPLVAVAGDYTGGTFFLCGSGEDRPVLYASSEGAAGVIGQTLREALEAVAGLPSWWDCLKFAGGGDLEVMGATADHARRDELADRPDADADREIVARALGLSFPPIPVLLERFHAAVRSTEPQFALRSDDGQYESLFGTFLPSHNPAWR